MSLFKVPKLRKKNSSWESTFNNTGQEDTCETFDFREISDLVEIGRGSFAAVFAAQYTTAKSSASKQVVVKKLFDLDVCEKGLFLKEVRLLHTLKHANIVSFHGMCTTPPSIMMEYMCFDFSPFEREQKVHSLKELLRELADGDPSEFIHVMPIIASDVTKGLRYLHDNGVVHRDLKPANVLVSNQHYCNLADLTKVERSWSTVPVICKLSDFGEARSQLIMTRNLNLTTTKDVNRGTPAFRAPEVLLPGHEQPMGLRQLKSVDIWALGLLFFCVVNPGLSTPYSYEFKTGENNENNEF